MTLSWPAKLASYYKNGIKNILSKALGGVATFVFLAFMFAFSPVTPAVDSPVHTTPSGTFIRYGEQTVFIEGIQLPQQVASTLIQAGVSAIIAPLTHYAMVYGMARAEQFLSEQNYHRLLEWLKDGSLLMPVHLFRIINTARRLLFASYPLIEELGSRISTLMGSKAGRIPFYPGKYLDQSVFIDVVKKPAAFAYIDITPLAPSPGEQAFTAWEQALADLNDNLLDLDVISLQVVDERKDGELLLRWYQGQEGNTQWHQHVLHTRNDTTLAFEDSRLLSIISPQSLRCIADVVAGHSANCSVDHSLFSIQRKPTYFAPADGETGMGYLRMSDSTSWSPGLPGELSFESSVYGGSISERSGQFRLPYWSALIVEGLLHEMAFRAARQVVNKGMDLWNQMRHQSHRYRRYRVFQGVRQSTGEEIPLVEVVKGPSGRHWIRKSAFWNHPDTNNPDGFIHLAEEAYILSNLDHKNIVKYHDSWLENPGRSKAKFVMVEEFSGKDLLSYPPRNLDEWKDIMRGALEGLEAAHSAGIGHFDISCRNITRGNVGAFRGAGVVKLIDFGAARHLDKHKMAFPQLCTDIYNAPERRNRRLMSANVDIWALGVLGVLGLESVRVPGAASASAALQNLDIRRQDFSLGSYLDKTTDYFDFLNRMLTKSREERPSASKMLKHPFLKSS